MSSCGCDFYNSHFCRELLRDQNTNVLIFTSDGCTTFGQVNQVDERIVTITPPTGSFYYGNQNVLVLTPNGSIIQEKYVQIDIGMIIAKATSIFANTGTPFACDCSLVD